MGQLGDAPAFGPGYPAPAQFPIADSTPWLQLMPACCMEDQFVSISPRTLPLGDQEVRVPTKLSEYYRSDALFQTAPTCTTRQ